MILQKTSNFQMQVPLDICSSFRFSFLKSCMKVITELNLTSTKIEVTTLAGQNDYYCYLYWQTIIICTSKIKW